MLHTYHSIFVLMLLFLGIQSCGDDKSKGKKTDHSQAEDTQNLTDAPLFGLTDTQMPSGLGIVENPELVFNFVAKTDLFINGASSEKAARIATHSFTPLQEWVLQDEVGYNEERRSLVIKYRMKEFGMEKKLHAYRYLDTYVAFFCTADDLSIHKNKKATDLLKAIKAGEVKLCQNGRLDTLQQQNEMVKYRDEDNVEVREFSRFALMRPNNSPCITQMVDEDRASTSCGQYVHTYSVRGEGENRSVKQGIFYRAMGENLTYGAEMPYYVSGQFVFFLNNWKGMVEYEETGFTPTLIIADEAREKAFKRTL